MTHGLPHQYANTQQASTASRAAYATRIASSSCANADGPRFVAKDGYRVWAYCLQHGGHGCPVREG